MIFHSTERLSNFVNFLNIYSTLINEYTSKKSKFWNRYLIPLLIATDCNHKYRSKIIESSIFRKNIWISINAVDIIYILDRYWYCQEGGTIDYCHLNKIVTNNCLSVLDKYSNAFDSIKETDITYQKLRDFARNFNKVACAITEGRQAALDHD